MSWHLKVQYRTRRGLRWVQFGPMTYFQARDEGRRRVREGHNARLVDPDGREGPLIMLPSTSPPRTPGQLELQLGPKE